MRETPTLSEALALTEIVVAVVKTVPDAGLVIATVGGVVSPDVVEMFT